MFKFMVKVVIVVLVLHTGMSYLKKERILDGDIRINYLVLKEKLKKLVPTQQLAAELVEAVNSKISPESKTASAMNQQTKAEAEADDLTENQDSRFVIHVVEQGETLQQLSRLYGVPSRVIQRINNLSSQDELTVGQEIRIPNRTRDLT